MKTKDQNKSKIKRLILICMCVTLTVLLVGCCRTENRVIKTYTYQNGNGEPSRTIVGYENDELLRRRKSRNEVSENIPEIKDAPADEDITRRIEINAKTENFDAYVQNVKDALSASGGYFTQFKEIKQSKRHGTYMECVVVETRCDDFINAIYEQKAVASKKEYSVDIQSPQCNKDCDAECHEMSFRFSENGEQHGNNDGNMSVFVYGEDGWNIPEWFEDRYSEFGDFFPFFFDFGDAFAPDMEEQEDDDTKYAVIDISVYIDRTNEICFVLSIVTSILLVVCVILAVCFSAYSQEQKETKKEKKDNHASHPDISSSPDNAPSEHGSDANAENIIADTSCDAPKADEHEEDISSCADSDPDKDEDLLAIDAQRCATNEGKQVFIIVPHKCEDAAEPDGETKTETCGTEEASDAETSPETKTDEGESKKISDTAEPLSSNATNAEPEADIKEKGEISEETAAQNTVTENPESIVSQPDPSQIIDNLA